MKSMQRVLLQCLKQPSSACRLSSASPVLKATFGLDQSHEGIYEEAIAFGKQNLDACSWDKKDVLPVDQLKDAARELGVGGLYCSEREGGAGHSVLQGTLILEGIAQSNPQLASVLSKHSAFAWLVEKCLSHAQSHWILPDLVSMKKMATICATEAGSTSTTLFSTSAKKVVDKYILNGSKNYVPYADQLDHFLIVASNGGVGSSGTSCFLVDKYNTGLSFHPEFEIFQGWATPQTMQLDLVNVNVPLPRVISGKWPNKNAIATALGMLRLNEAAIALGTAQSALEDMFDLLNENGPGKVHVHMEKLISLSLHLAKVRSLMRDAAESLDLDGYASSLSTLMAKDTATETCLQVLEEAVLMHGGLNASSSIIRKIQKNYVHFRTDKNSIETRKMTKEALKKRLHTQQSQTNIGPLDPIPSALHPHEMINNSHQLTSII